jgi:PQQ-like domain
MPAASGPPRVYRSIRLDAAVYASPIVGGGVIAVATENNSVYGITSRGQVLWHRKLGLPARRSQLPCGNIDPSGITGTPAYSSATGLLYVVVEHGNPVRHAIAAINIRTGAVPWTRQLTLPGTAPNAVQQRGALTITGGRVWVTFGGRAGDCGAYKGRLIGLPLDGHSAAVAYTVPTAREAGMWTPAGPSVDASGFLYVAVGNGASGVGDPYDHSDSVLKLDSRANLLSSFSPTTWASDNAADLDLGSQGPALVGPWIFIAGKSGNAYVLRRTNLGGIGGQVSTNSSMQCRSFGGTAVSGTVVYAPCSNGVRAVRINADGSMTPLWQAAGVAGSPVIGGGRIWALNPGAGVLHGLNPANGASVGSVNVGQVSRFATPALYGNKVLIGTLSGLVIVTSSP